jgi:hypothetical protein
MSSAFLKSKVATASERETFGLHARLRQTIKADDYRGKHLRFSGDVKAEHVEQQSGLIVRIKKRLPPLRDERWGQGRVGRPRQETVGQKTHDWLKYEVSMPVPEDALLIEFGLVMHGTGQVWLANMRLEVVEQDGRLTV